MSGGKQVNYVTLEQALSTDLNRQQDFQTQQRADTFKALNNLRHAANGRYPFVQAEWPNPLPAGEIPHDVYGGLMVRPDQVNDLLIDPGTAGFIIPGQGGVDDSDYVLVNSPGVQSLGQLTFTPNVSGSARIDIVECRAVPAAPETASRNIFDPVSQTFSPQVIDKVVQYELEFRIVVGTPGGGLRDPDSEWCPLAIVFVQDSAAGFSSCDVYDVRPLVSARDISYNRFLVPQATLDDIGIRPTYRQLFLGSGGQNDTQVDRLVGYSEVIWGGYITGGMIRMNGVSDTPGFGTDQDTQIDLSDPVNHLTTIVVGSGGAKHFSLCAYFPGRYPRWVRYSQLPVTADTNNDIFITGRIPTGPGGILMLGPEDVVNNNGLAFNVAGWPAQYGGLASASGYFVCMIRQGNDDQVRITGGSLSAGFVYGTWDDNSGFPQNQAAPTTTLASTLDSNDSKVTAVIDHSDVQTFGFPPCATGLLLRVEGNLGTSNSSDVINQIRNHVFWRSTTSNLGFSYPAWTFNKSGETSYEFNWCDWLTMPGGRVYDSSQLQIGLVTHIEHTTGGLLSASGNVYIDGYRLQ